MKFQRTDVNYSGFDFPGSLEVLRFLVSPSGLLIQPLVGVCESETPCFTLQTPYTALGRSSWVWDSLFHPPDSLYSPWQESVSPSLLVSPSGLLIQPLVGVSESQTPCFTLQTPYTALGRSLWVSDSLFHQFTLQTPYTALGRSQWVWDSLFHPQDSLYSPW